MRGLRRLQLEECEGDPAAVVAVVAALPLLAALRAAVEGLTDAHLAAICEVIGPIGSGRNNSFFYSRVCPFQTVKFTHPEMTRVSRQFSMTSLCKHFAA